MADRTAQDQVDFTFNKLFRELRLQVDVGRKFHRLKRNETDTLFCELYSELGDQLDYAKGNQEFIFAHLSEYDFVSAYGVRVKGNGYRSLLGVFKCCAKSLLKCLQACSRERGTMLVTLREHYRNIKPFANTFKSLAIILHCAACVIKNDIVGNEAKGELFCGGELGKKLIRMVIMEDVDREYFYGQCLGFQYVSYSKDILKAIVIAMATYEDWYKADKKDPVKQILESLLKGGKYIRNPIGRGEKVAELTQFSDISFTKAFWSIFEQETIKRFLKFVSSSVDVCTTILVPSKDILIEGSNGLVQLKPPFSDEIGYSPIPVTLLSFKRRDGQQLNGAFSQRCVICPPSSGLIVHIHGGGFVSQSVKSHEMYLRHFARDLDVPIISIEYTHAPEGPFPRAFDECLFVYAWALNNLQLLGTTAEKIVFFGDSAGGNIVLSVALKAKQLGLRVPDGVVSVYPVTYTKTLITPSRMLSVMDPLLPVGIMFSCLHAYTSNLPNEEMSKKRSDLRHMLQVSKGKFRPVSEESQGFLQFRFKRKSKKSSEEETPEDNPKSQNKKSSSDSPKQPPARPPPPPNKNPATEDLNSIQSSHTLPKAEDNATEETVRTAPPRPPRPRAMSVPSKNPLHLLDADAFLEIDSSKEASESEKSKDEEDLKSATAILETIEVSEEVTKDTPAVLSPLKQDHILPPVKYYNSDIESLAAEVLASYEDSDVTDDPFVSPFNASSDMWRGLPPICLVAAELDPLLDDSVAMARKLRSLNHEVHLDVMRGLSHGFLNFSVNPDTSKAIETVLRHLKRLVL